MKPIFKYRLKSYAYKSAIFLHKFILNLLGQRRIAAFGEYYSVTPDTIFPTYRRFQLPHRSCFSEIVRYTDYVQLHSVVAYLMRLNKNPVIVDIGAHHGAYVIVCGKIAKSLNGKVIAVEPNPRSFNILVRNVNLNGLSGIVECENVAILDRPCSVKISLENGQSKIANNHGGKTVDVQAITFEDLISKHRVDRLDLIIIDVEGAELPVLNSIPWDSLTVDRIYCELHPYAWKDFSYNGKDFQAFLANHNFRCFDMYLQEHKEFISEGYIGPALFLKT